MTQEADAAERQRRRRLFFYARVFVLLVVLVGVLGYAWRDVTSRAERTRWSRPLSVAFVIVETQPLHGDVRDLLHARKWALEARVEREMRRYRAEGEAPLLLEIVGPVALAIDPPRPPRDGGVLEAARYAWDLWRFTQRVDGPAGLDGRRHDSRVYVVARPPDGEAPRMVEGASQDGGRIGVVSCAIGRDSVDFTLFVATHELFHTLGATDKYGPDRMPVVPDGLAEPSRVPLYPQRGAELMAGTRALGPKTAALPYDIEELVVGELTAREIGWLRGDPR